MDFTAGLFRSFNLDSISFSKNDDAVALASTFNSRMVVHKTKNAQTNNAVTLQFPIPP